MFALDPGLTRSAIAFLELPLSTVLLKDDARWPWLLLVPRIPGAGDMTDLDDVASVQLAREIARAARAIKAEDGVERTNVGALGNIVPQLHVHVVGRRAGDAAWPGPVWGVEGRIARPEAGRDALLSRLKTRLS